MRGYHLLSKDKIKFRLNKFIIPRSSNYLKKLVYSKDYETTIEKVEKFSVAKLFEVEFQMMKNLEELKNILYQSLRGDYFTLIAMMLDNSEIKYGGQKTFNNYMLRAEKIRTLSQNCQFFVSDYDISIFFSRVAKENTEYIFANALINSIIPYKTEFECFKSLSKTVSKAEPASEIKKQESSSSKYNESISTPTKPLQIYSNSHSVEVKPVIERDITTKNEAFYSSFGLKGSINSSKKTSHREEIPLSSPQELSKEISKEFNSEKAVSKPISKISSEKEINSNSKGLASYKEKSQEIIDFHHHSSQGLKESSKRLEIEIPQHIETPIIEFSDKLSLVSDILPDTNEEILIFLLENISEILKEREIVKSEFLKTTGISLETMFSLFDVTRKKAISIGDLKKVLKSLELTYEDDILRLLFLRYDVDFDGFLNYAEFKKLLKPIKLLVGSVSPMSYEFTQHEDFSKYSNPEFKRKISRLLLFLLRTEEAWEFLKRQLQKTENFSYFNSFEAIDMNGDNYITCEDLKKFASIRNSKLEADELFDLLDKTGKSKLSYDQFYKELTPFK